MKQVFVISDTHFGHDKMLTFLRADGSPVRPEFKTSQEMDEFMVEQWNSVVRPCDKVYHLGDVAIGARNIHTLGRLNGDKVLIRGNHDTERISLYRRYFRDIRAMHVHNNALLSHVPIHPDSLSRFSLNIHGHLHCNFVMRDGVRDNRYVNVCVEHYGYRPILLDWVIENAKKEVSKVSEKTSTQDTGYSLEELKTILSNRVYEATRLIEDLEHQGKILGNGHHARQKLAAQAVEELESRWIK